MPDLLSGSELEQGLNAMGVQPLDIEQQMLRLEIGELVYDRQEVNGQINRVAMLILTDELEYIDEAMQTGEMYIPPVIVIQERGGLLAGVKVCEKLCDYGIDATPVTVHISGYGSSQEIAEVEVKKDFSDEDLILMSGRRIIILDDGNETGDTKRATVDHINNSLQGSRKHVGADGIPRDEVLRPPVSIKSGFVWDKGIDEEGVDYLGAPFPDRWGTGAGYNTRKEHTTDDGQLVVIDLGYFAMLGGIDKNAPPHVKD